MEPLQIGGFGVKVRVWGVRVWNIPFPGLPVSGDSPKRSDIPRKNIDTCHIRTGPLSLGKQPLNPHHFFFPTPIITTSHQIRFILLKGYLEQTALVGLTLDLSSLC